MIADTGEPHVDRSDRPFHVEHVEEEKRRLGSVRRAPAARGAEEASPRPGTPLVTTAAAVALLLVYLGAAWLLADTFALRAEPKDSSYERAMAIFAGIQSIGFAAAGVLLGVTVQQPRIADARAGERKAKQAIRDVIAPGSDELAGGKSLPPAVINRLAEGL